MAREDIEAIRATIGQYKPSKKRVKKLEELFNRPLSGVTDDEDEELYFILEDEIKRQMQALGIKPGKNSYIEMDSALKN